MAKCGALVFSSYSPVSSAFLEGVGISDMRLLGKVFESGYYSERKLSVYSSGSCEFNPVSFRKASNPGSPGGTH